MRGKILNVVKKRAMIEVYKVQAVGMRQIFSKQRMAEKNVSKIK